MTECCSCENQRGEDTDMPHDNTLVHYNDDVSGCLADQVSQSDQAEWIGGTFVWASTNTAHRPEPPATA